jgi:hypothetical protein
MQTYFKPSGDKIVIWGGARLYSKRQGHFVTMYAMYHLPSTPRRNGYYSFHQWSPSESTWHIKRHLNFREIIGKITWGIEEDELWVPSR